MGFHLLQRMGITNRTFDKPPVLAPAPVPAAASSPSTLLGSTLPPDASATMSAATLAARQAAARQRQRAAGGLGAPALKAPGLGAPAGVAKPRSLLGY